MPQSPSTVLVKLTQSCVSIHDANSHDLGASGSPSATSFPTTRYFSRNLSSQLCRFSNCSWSRSFRSSKGPLRSSVSISRSKLWKANPRDASRPAKFSYGPPYYNNNNKLRSVKMWDMPARIADNPPSPQKKLTGP